MKKIAFIALFLAIPALTGCDDPGPFVNQVQNFSAKEKERDDDLIPTLVRYREMEKEKPAALMKHPRDFMENERDKSDDFMATLVRFREHTKESLPRTNPSVEDLGEMTE